MGKKYDKKTFHTDIVKKSLIINSPKPNVWKKISNVAGLEWLVDEEKTEYLSKKKRGIGAIRKITFNDGNSIEEHIVDWKNNESFTYIVTEGLPLRAYIATISIKPKNKNSVKLTWQSYINSKKMTKNEFGDFIAFMNSFYKKSLSNLKSILEKKLSQSVNTVKLN